jgi:fatty acid desaturase
MEKGMKTNKIIRLERNMEVSVSGILSALLCAMVALSWAPLLVVGVYFFLLLWHFIEWYFELKREKVRGKFKTRRQNAH